MMTFKVPHTPVFGSRARGRLALTVVAATLAMAPSAAAQTTFQASVTAKDTRPQPCPNGAFLCGTADIAGYGTADWADFLTSVTDEGTCNGYTATDIFTLADGSTLTLDENATACTPGKSNLTPTTTSYGHPGAANGTWSVQSATGQFSGMTGAGTDTLKLAGATASATSTGTVNP